MGRHRETWGDWGRQGEIWIFLPHLGATAVIAAMRKALRVRRARGYGAYGGGRGR